MKKALLLLPCFLFFISAFSQQGVYLKLDGVKGDQGGKHKDEFLISAFESNGANSATVSAGTGAGAGKVNFSPIVLQKALVPSANLDLMLNLATGRHIQTASITWYDASDAAYYQINLSDVLLSEVSILSPKCTGDNCNNLYEQISLVFQKIQWKDPVRNTVREYDLKTNKGS